MVAGDDQTTASTTAQVCIVRRQHLVPYTGVGMLSYLGIGPITLERRSMRSGMIGW